MMKPLTLKLLRDLGQMKGQMMAVGLVMACGLAMMIMSRSLILSLESTREAYYVSYRFAEIFSDLKRAPNTLRARLTEISGVSLVETRVKGAATLDIPGMVEPADATILSLPDDRPAQLHLLHLRSGRLPESRTEKEVVVGEAFAQAHGLAPGDFVEATIYGARERLKIVGIALSPEFVFESRPGDTLPDNRRFGVFWMGERELAKALNLDGAFNSVLLDLAPGANPNEVMASLDQVLEPYGGLLAYGREDHPSASRLDDELRVLRGLSVAFPLVFLSISAFMTSAVLSRLVRLQREQIAQLKAFGYSSQEVGLHYLQYALVIVLIATILGGLAGFWLGTNVVELYHRFFKFPSLTFQPDWPIILIALTVSAFSSFLGVLGAVWQAVKLPPAEAMRPEPPAEFRPSLLEKLGLQRWVSPALRMALRNLERKPWQAFFTALGLALAAAIPVVPGAMKDGINFLMDFQWSLAQRQDATLSLIEPSSFQAWRDVVSLPGVLTAEPFRSVPASIRFGHRSRRIAVIGLPLVADLNRLLDQQGRPIALPPSGLLLSAKLAEILQVQPGEQVRLEIQEGRRPHLDVTVAGTITDFSGISAYLRIDSLQRLMQEGPTISGAHVAVDPVRWKDFLQSVKEAPRVGSLAVTAAGRESFDQSTGEMIGTLQAIYFGFAVIVSFGVVYNSARISLSERSRDLATLRVVGFTHGEVASVLIGELALLTLLAIIPGLYIGSALADMIVQTASTETVRLPLVLTSQTYATAALIVLTSSAFSFLVVSRRIRHLDLLGVLKARD